MAAPPFDTNAGTALVTNNGNAAGTMGKMPAVIFAAKPDTCVGFTHNSGNPLLENLICHNRKLLYV